MMKQIRILFLGLFLCCFISSAVNASGWTRAKNIGAVTVSSIVGLLISGKIAEIMFPLHPGSYIDFSGIFVVPVAITGAFLGGLMAAKRIWPGYQFRIAL